MLILFTLKQCQFFCLSPIFLIADFAGLHHKHHTPQITNCKKLEYFCDTKKPRMLLDMHMSIKWSLYVNRFQLKVRHLKFKASWSSVFYNWWQRTCFRENSLCSSDLLFSRKTQRGAKQHFLRRAYHSAFIYIKDFLCRQSPSWWHTTLCQMWCRFPFIGSEKTPSHVSALSP